MLSVRNIPIVIEPGVGAIEAEFSVSEGQKNSRIFPVQLFRVQLNEHEAEKLPFIPSVKRPHVFALTHDPEESAALIVYDSSGRICLIYTRDETGKSWEKREVAAEHAGKTIAQFSVRFSFSSAKTRDKFMELVDGVIAQMHNDQKPNPNDVAAAFALLSRSRVSPVLLPIAVAKSSVKGVKL